MLTERDLLLDIIQNTPEFSIWNISSDSWEKIPEVFSEFITMNDVYGWDINIDLMNREKLLKIIDKEEISDKIIHQHISFKGNVIFKSYDRMLLSYLDSSILSFKKIIEKYKELEDFFLEEM